VNILAIRFARLGDVVLLLPALSSLKRAFPDARLTLATGHRCAPIAELCPAIDDVLAVNRIAMRDGPVFSALREMTRLLRDVRGRRFDLVIDFHSLRETNLLTWLSGAPVRIAMKRHKSPYLKFCFNRPPVLEDKTLHVAEMFERVVEGVIEASPSGRGRCEAAGEGLRFRQILRPSTSLEASPSRARASRPLPEGEGQFRQILRRSQLVIPDDVMHWADQIASNKPRLALYIDAPVPERIWPPEQFAAIADFAIEHLGALPIVISSQPGQDLARRVRRACRKADQLAVFTDLSIPQLAALIKSARLFVSNDTGPMHIGPAAGTPTLGLFSVGYPEHFRPIGPNDRFLRANPIEKIEKKEVIAAVQEMWAIADPNLRC
jgi:ADP-heptose:LPS heptosyltransferase